MCFTISLIITELSRLIICISIHIHHLLASSTPFIIYIITICSIHYFHTSSEIALQTRILLMYLNPYISRLILYITLKAILQVLIYKALYDKSYLGSKTTMTSGEWTCLISFATAPLTCSERGGSEKFKMKIYVSCGIRTHTPPVHDRKVAAP